MAKAKDLTGQRFGRLVVQHLSDEPYISPKGKKTRRWVCLCDCGKEATVLNNALTGGTIKSCGCILQEQRESVIHDLTGKRFGRWTVLQREPLPHKTVSGEAFGWLCRCDCGNEKVVITKNLLNGRSKSCGCLKAEMAAKRITENNSLKKFEGTTISAIQPERKPNKNSSSGMKGVYWNANERKWIAKIGVQGKTITLGRFRLKEDAAEARRKAEQKYFVPLIEEFESKNLKHDVPPVSK